tara:strand:- start:2939 stop:4096 length:1158 start_codon:yes stop_codon:yes gene_type:complete
MTLFKIIQVAIALISLSKSYAVVSETQLRDAQVKLWEAAESVSRILAKPAEIILGGLMGCQPPIKNQTSRCPDNFIQDYKNYDDKSVSETKVIELQILCSPRSQGYPENDINKPSASLTPECAAALNKLIPWRGNFAGDNVDTEREEELKESFIKGIWGALFFHRVVPAAYSEDGLDCASLEQDLFGASSKEEYSLEKWLRGDLIHTDILDALLTMRIDIGFTDNDICKKSRTFMFYDNNMDTIGLCRKGSKALTDKSTVFVTSTIIHELRHSHKIFGTLSSHNHSCPTGGQSGCDEGEYGSYGTELIFADQILAGSKQILADLSGSSQSKESINRLVKSSVGIMCESNRMVFETDNPLYYSIGVMKPCAENKRIEFFVDVYKAN